MRQLWIFFSWALAWPPCQYPIQDSTELRIFQYEELNIESIFHLRWKYNWPGPTNFMFLNNVQLKVSDPPMKKKKKKNEAWHGPIYGSVYD